MSVAEAVFKPVTSKPAAAAPLANKVTSPGAKEVVSIRLDSDVLAHFQEEGPGWQERINAALRNTAGL